MSCESCNLDTICLPRGLPKQEITKLSALVESSHILQRGELIYRQNDAFKGIVAIKSGSAKVISHDNQGNENILSILLPGELMGFDGMAQNSHNCSVVALEVISYCELSADNFDKVSQQNPSITIELLKHASQSLCDFQNQFFLNKRPAEEKVALFLTNLSERLERRGFSSLSFIIPLTRQEMGNYLGLTLETVSRMLHQLQNSGFIKVQRRHIDIYDIKSLQALCD